MEMAPKILKALLDDRASVGLNEVVCGCCPCVQVVAGGCTAADKYRFEAAGRSFAARFEARPAVSPSSASSGSDAATEETEEVNRKDKSGGYLRISDLLKGVNLYKLMGISEGASQDAIKKAYRALALTAHPDKQAQLEPLEAKKVQENFVKIQEAYELLSDPSKRKQYDSSLDFDESLPKFRPDSGQDFFQVFGEVFRRNARFSVKRPVPDLGSLEDEPRVWKRFYDFWYGFQSWRDPVMLAQKAGEEICDLEEAECREERRWMMRENQRVARQYKQQEQSRIAKLVSLAESFDPRIQAEKEAKRLARQAEAAKREEEQTAARRAKEEMGRQQRAAEEAARLAEEQKRKDEKAKRDAIKERVKKCRQRLRSFHPAVKEHVVLEQVNEVCLQFTEEQLKELGNQIEKALTSGGDAMAAASLFHKAIESIGLAPMKVSEDATSTTSGPTDSQEDAQTTEERRESERRQAEKDQEKAEERARLAAERAEEKKKKEEQKKREAAAAEAARRQQEKKEEMKAKKAEEKQKKQEEEERLRKEQQRELAKQKAQEQAQRDRQAAQAEKEKLELERLVNLFAKDRLERLAKLDPLSDEKLAASLQVAVDEDKALAASLGLLKGKMVELRDELTDTQSDPLDRAVALVSEGKAGSVWPLALAPPANLRLENALRNRVKKARNRLRDVVGSFLHSCNLPNNENGAVTDWQRDVVNGLLVPTWSPAQEPSEPPSKPGPEKKKKKEKETDEDLDRILAEFEDSSPGKTKKKPGKKK